MSELKENFTFNEQPPKFDMEMPMPMEMDNMQFAEEFIEEFFMEMDQEFMICLLYTSPSPRD